MWYKLKYCIICQDIEANHNQTPQTIYNVEFRINLPFNIDIIATDIVRQLT